MPEVVPRVQAGSVLERIVADTRERVSDRRARMPIGALEMLARARPPARDFVAALRAPGVGVMAEIKRGSPSKGLFAPDLDPAVLARTFSEIGAVAVSVLTSPDFSRPTTTCAPRPRRSPAQLRRCCARSFTSTRTRWSKRGRWARTRF